MKKLRRRYAMKLVAITLTAILIAGTITAEKNSRYLIFGEEYKTVEMWYNEDSPKGQIKKLWRVLFD